MSMRRVAGSIRSLVNARDLQLECASLAVQRDNLRGFLGIKRMDRVPNAQKTKLCGVKKSLDERIDEGILWWYILVERMDSGRIAKSLCRSMCW